MKNLTWNEHEQIEPKHSHENKASNATIIIQQQQQQQIKSK